METPYERFALSAWRGEFRDPAEERAYRKHVEPAAARHLRTSVTVWASLLLLFGSLDFLALGLSSGFVQLMAARGISAALLLLLAWRLKYNPHWATSGYAVTILEIVGFTLFFLIYFVRPDIIIWNIGVTLILLLCLYIFIPNRVVLSNVAAGFGIVGTLVCVRLTGADAAKIISLFILLCLPTTVGMIAALRLQMVQRRQFALHTEMVEINASLQEEIERREALEVELQKQATTDPLTGLFNRRQYELLFNRERERSRRLGTELSLCVLDLDHFKQINDLHGHDVGDQVLRHVAALFGQTLRQTDIIGRFGGEEFILLLPETSLEQSERLIDRLRQRLEGAPLETDEQTIRITATFGLTAVQDEDKTIEDIVKRADRALYLGKQSGRNRVVTADHGDQ
ncbi:GGDEF domain-containing protein [Halopseudomonas nanhaiensis]|uniref:GGDEF domain-containing protein n=1 Tax=Halopseudomonas nanhaiensis TaxID=2830842 RepID=UPI001CBD42D6|nr:GGDEF domain-containing protein [Halopseudomonas nanhaiensis]UAW97653.1 GGDEF domain-containing protein [Halopseudomonas nanhaiensis]